MSKKPSTMYEIGSPLEDFNSIIDNNFGLKFTTNIMEQKRISNVRQALQRLNKYEEILSRGRLTDRNYENTTLDIDSCKPYLRLGELEDIYEEGKHNE